MNNFSESYEKILEVLTNIRSKTNFKSKLKHQSLTT